MSSKNCFSRARDKNADLESTYPCTMRKCSANNSMFMQCYVCGEEFHHFSELKYHLNRHYGNKKVESDKNCQFPLTRKSSQNMTQRPNHVRRVQSGQRRKSYKCTICRVNFSTSSSLVVHKKVHTGIGNKKCDICNIPFTTGALIIHTRLFHPGHAKKILKEQTQCKICKRIFLCNSSLVIHERIHTGDFKCEICQIHFTKIGLVTHKRYFHPDQPKSSYPCNVCKKAFISIRDRVRHEKIHSGDHKCEICKISFTGRAFVRHMKQFHPRESEKILTETRRTQHKCNICNSTFNSNSHLVRHERVHMGDHKCEICQIPFTKNSLITHTKLLHPDKSHTVMKPKPRQCSICKKSFVRQSVQQKLINKGTFICKKCKVPFTKKVLSTHKLGCHAKPSLPHQCKDCKKRYRSPDELMEHAAIHKGAFECFMCHIPFTKNALLNHQRLHHSLKQFQCTICNENFSLKSNLKQHKAIHRSQFKCKFCKLPFMLRCLADHEKRCSELVPGKESSTSEEATEVESESHSNDTVSEQNGCNSESFECYICKSSLTSTKDLRTHLTKHIVYEEWVHPINVHLSNWSPDKSREILLNQPLVLVENLNIANVNLNFAIDLTNRRNEIGLERVKSESNLTSVIERNESENRIDIKTETVKVEYGTIALPYGEMPYKIDEYASNCQITIEFKPPFNDES